MSATSRTRFNLRFFAYAKKKKPRQLHCSFFSLEKLKKNVVVKLFLLEAKFFNLRILSKPSTIVKVVAPTLEPRIIAKIITGASFSPKASS